MITTGKYLSGSQHSTYHSGSYPPPQAQIGTVWWDSGRNKLVVYTGSSWNPVEDISHISLTEEAQNAIDWVIARIQQERRVMQMADKYPMVASALRELETVLKLHENLDDDEQS